ncbi:MAG TPA: type III-A CRISPR-associated RAMP protein Csm3, partial [Chloroflexia bacterium]|nr:type III-A CRISPR-associated RAMP protein Csm3 [Chloroflexia bacterium]
KTGLHIGGASSTLSIGGVDNVVIRDALTGQPYIPGSSIRGKMRSLSEKLTNRVQNQPIGQGVRIHVCKEPAEYATCEVCPIFGIPGELQASGPTRLKVRDVFLTPDSVQEMSRLRTELPFTEIKWEATIDRVTSAAVPRQMERVPSGAVFGPFQFVYSIHDIEDVARFAYVIRAMELVEDDYLGGQGSRGSGQVAFTDLKLQVKTRDDYGPTRATREPELTADNLEGFQGKVAELDLRSKFNAGE